MTKAAYLRDFHAFRAELARQPRERFTGRETVRDVARQSFSARARAAKAALRAAPARA